MVNYDTVAEKIFAIIKGHGFNLSLFTDEGMDTSEPSEARRFYVKQPNFMITLEEESDEIKINKNSNVSLEDMESILTQLKNLARQNMLNTQIKVFGKEIAPKDFAYQAQHYKKDGEMSNLGEASLSKMHGSKKTSYQTLESVKVIVRHRKAVDEEVRGSRSRQIKAIFLEQAGERFRFPHNHLAGARAMARHMYEGGNMQDTIGEYIIESVNNVIKLAEFVRYTRTNKLINETSEDIIKIVKENIATLRTELKGLIGAKSYHTVSEAISSREESILEEDDTVDLQDIFTVHKFDEKIGDMLPLVRKLMNEKAAWRTAIVEASEQQIFMKAKEDLAEEDVMEFDNPLQQVGYKIGKIAKRMVETDDLSKFVSRVAGKLIEGETISDFEKTVVRNVMENAIIEEEKECEDCGCVDCTCNEGNDALGSIMDSFNLKMKMIEHEDVFEEGPKKTACSRCNGIGREPGPPRGGKIFTQISCKACGGYGYGLSGDPARSLSRAKVTEDNECPDCDGEGVFVDDTECLSCGGSGRTDREGRMEEDHHTDEIEAGAHNGMPSTDPFGSGIVVSDVIKLLARGETVRSTLGGAIGNVIDMDDDGFATIQHRYRGKSKARIRNWKGLDLQKGGGEWILFNNSQFDESLDEGDDDPAAMYEDELNKLRKAAGIDVVEEDVDPEDFMNECPDCKGTGKARTKIVPPRLKDTGDCPTCKGEGYV